MLWSFQLSGWSTCRPHSCLMAWLASEQPTKSYHFFLTSHQCQVPSLFPNTYNFVLQTFTPAKISHHKWLSMKIQAILFVQICNQRICVTSYSVPFSPSESLPVSPSSTISMFFSWMSQRTAGTAAAAVFLLLFSLQKCRFFNLACLVNRMRSPQYSSKHFGSSCAIRFRTFQGSLQIPSQWNRAFQWWIRFILRCLDTYMMCYSYDSYELPPPCHNQLRSAQNLVVEKFWSPWRWSEVVQVAKCSQRNDRKSKRHKTCKALVDLNRYFGNAISMQCRYHIHRDRLADLVWKKSLLPRDTLTRAWKMKPLVMVDATWRKFGETFHRGEPWSHMEPCGAKEPHPSMSPMLLMHHRVQRTIRWPNAWKQVLKKVQAWMFWLFSKH